MGNPDPDRPTRDRARDNGEGSVYKAADGRWRGSITIGFTPDGRQRRRYVSAPTKGQARAKLIAAIDARDAGVDTTSDPTVEQWLTHWLDKVAAPTVRPSTLEGYTTAVNHWAIPELGKVKLSRLTPDHLEALYTLAVTTGKPRRHGADPKPASAGTVRLLHRTLARALQVAHERGRISRNPAKLAHVPTGPRRKIAAFEEVDARRILAAAEGTWNAARWSVALALGLRQGEALGLTWDHVDLDEGVIHVRQALQRIPRGVGLQLVEVKSSAGERDIPVPPSLLAAMREHRRAQLAARVQDGPNWSPWTTRALWPDGPEKDVELVFAQRSGRPIDTRADHRAWEALLQSAGVRDARLHDARHTAATLLLEQGVSPKVVQEILGHSSISLTLGTYAHVTRRLAAEAARAMEGSLWGDDEVKALGSEARRAAKKRRNESGLRAV